MSRTGGIRLHLIGLALFAALPLVALAVYRLSDQAVHERRMVSIDAEYAATTAAARIDERLLAADALLLGLSTTMRADPALREQNEEVLRRTLTKAPSPIANLFLLDTAGTLVATARTVGPSGDSVRAFADRGYFAIVRRERGLVVGEIRRSAVLEDHPWVVVLARAIVDGEGRFTGVVSMPVRLDSLAGVARGTLSMGNALVTIFDTAGVVLARSADPDSVVGKKWFDSGLRIDSTGSGSMRWLDDTVRFTAFTRTRSAPWLVNLGIPEQELEARLGQELRDEVLLFLFTIGLAVTVAYLLGQRLTQPIAALVSAARSFERGETGTRAAPTGPGEIRLLGNAFNQMAETVERRNAALADSERRYRFLFDSNPLPMWAWDADTLQIMAVNEAAIEKYGYDRDRFLSLRITDLLDPSEMERFGNARLPFSENRQSAGLWLHRNADGTPVEMEVITASSRRLGRASWLSVGIDITARRVAERALARSEEQLRQVQKMEAIGTFAGGISHDFNNLLTGMLGYCDLALSELAPDSEAAKDIAEVRALAVRGGDLTRQILTVSRKQVVQPTQFDPNDVVRGLDRLLRRVLGAHIDLETQLATDVGTMRADASQLEQVLLNLTANSRDAMPTGGTLRVTTNVVNRSAAIGSRMPPGELWILITVSDTGTGMPADVRDRIFEPFFTTKERGKGTGLGLALAYAMVEQAGGVIRVDSEPGLGTTFYLYFPRHDGAVEIPDAPPTPSESLSGNETILFAEDEESVRAVATAALERQGYRMLVAANGDAAIAMAQSYPGHIDMLLCDVVMPGTGGREVAERLRQLRPGIQVMFVSGYTDDESLLGDVRADERLFLQKPFTGAELVKRVRQALDQPTRAVRN